MSVSELACGVGVGDGMGFACVLPSPPQADTASAKGAELKNHMRFMSLSSEILLAIGEVELGPSRDPPGWGKTWRSTSIRP